MKIQRRPSTFVLPVPAALITVADARRSGATS